MLSEGVYFRGTAPLVKGSLRMFFALSQIYQYFFEKKKENKNKKQNKTKNADRKII